MPNQKIDGIKFFQRKDGYFKARIKYAHRYVWEKNFGEIPKDFHVHHKDGDKSNNKISNLELIDKREHATLHKKAWFAANRKRGLEIIAKNRSGYMSFLKTKEGKDKCRKTALAQAANSPIKKRKCIQCGVVFKYKTAFRRGFFCTTICRYHFSKE